MASLFEYPISLQFAQRRLLNNSKHGANMEFDSPLFYVTKKPKSNSPLPKGTNIQAQTQANSDTTYLNLAYQSTDHFQSHKE